jgi:putative hydrolase of the HAD superfamily
MGYRAVVFDLFGTLVHPFAPALYERSLEEMAGALGLEPAAFRRLWWEDTSQARITGVLPTVEANLEHIAQALGASPTAPQLAEAVRIRLAFYRATLVPRADAVATLQAIKALGLRLGLISDCSCEAPLLWRETSFAALIDEPVFSCRAGFRKPDPRFFRLACERLDVQPQDCVYVADGYRHELAAAHSLGMHAVLIAVPGEETLSDGMMEAATWQGPRVAALSEVVRMVP